MSWLLLINAEIYMYFLTFSASVCGKCVAVETQARQAAFYAMQSQLISCWPKENRAKNQLQVAVINIPH